MANITTFNPFRTLGRSLGSWDPMREFRDLYREMQSRFPMTGAELSADMKIDVSETDQGYLIKAEIPGVSKEDIQVSVDGSQVSISAEVKKEKEEKGKTSVYSERYYGKQYRSFTLEHDVDDTKALASYKDGILEMTLPKKLGDNRRKLTVQ